MKKIVLSILAVLMLVKAEPVHAVAWSDFSKCLEQITTTATTFFYRQLQTNTSSITTPALIGAGMLVLAGFGYLALKAGKAKKQTSPQDFALRLGGDRPEFVQSNEFFKNNQF